MIRSDEAYSMEEFRLRAGVGDYTWRRLRRELPVVAIGKKRFVRGADWLDYLESQANRTTDQ